VTFASSFGSLERRGNVSSDDIFGFLNKKMEENPRWEHDCVDCTWLGSLGDADLYACILGVGPDNLRIQTVIARYGPDGEYVSGLDFVNQNPRLAAAFNRAQTYILQVRYNALADRQGIHPKTVIPSVPINAFNLWEGATFMHDGRVYIVHHYEAFSESEKVIAVAHRGDEPEDPYVIPFLFDYMDKVSIIGNVRNPQDFDDNDWGN
jgi:hypothetical protein